ncbi:MAG TPA: hypothetical protein VNR70_15035 [Steroidobacteraceae bacterium]|nr:hypothetical protein [Steroidobacteraceae bacterium]
MSVRFVTLPSTAGIGRLLNVSSTGAFMETNLNLRLLSLLYLQPAEEPSVTLTTGHLAATVVRQGRGGFGLEWCEFGAETTRVYACLVGGSRGRSDAYQLQLPAMPDAR